MFESARIRLTLWYFLTISFILLLFSALIFRISSVLLFENISRFHIRLQAEQLGFNLPPRFSGTGREIKSNLLNPESEEFLSDLENAKEKLLLSLIFIDLGILTISTFLAYILAGRTLAPIEKSLLAQKRFTADAAHELRTPLTAIKTALEVNLKDKSISKEVALGILKDNLKDIESLQKLSNDLLLLSKVEHSGQKLNLQTVAFDELALELLNKFGALAKKKNIKIISKAKHDLVKTDYDKLMQILSIFVDNAIKYTPTDGKVSLHFFSEKNKAVFQVKDNGVGISKDNLTLIFDRFFKIESSRNKNSSAGFGLGLAIAGEIARLLNGRIIVTSQPGKGSTFGFYL
jgi:signal transduction histidine kinase